MNITPTVDSTASKVLVREGEILGISHLRGEGQPVGVRPASGPVEQVLDIVGGDYVAATASGGQCGVAVTGGDIEDLPAGTHVDRLAQLLSHQLQRGADHCVVARGPGGVLLLLDCRQGLEGQGLAHVILLFAAPLGSLAVAPDSDELGHVARSIGGNHGIIMTKRHQAVVGRTPHFRKCHLRPRWGERPILVPKRSPTIGVRVRCRPLGAD